MPFPRETFRVIVGDLFSGIGGFALAAEWMGWETAFFSEIDPYASAVLRQHWPTVPNLGDITRIDWTTAPRVDLICGGFPCQPHSLAGRRQASIDPRDLWSECVRALRSVRPAFAVFENVTGLLTSDRGGFFNRVLSDLAALGFDVEWSVLSAAELGAPQQRDRVWIVCTDPLGNAHRDRERQPQGTQPESRRRTPDASEELGHAGGTGRQKRDAPAIPAHPGHAPGQRWRAGHWRDGKPVRGRDGTVRLIPGEAADAGPQSPLWPVVDGIPGRVARLRAIGNSIVPPVALEIFQSLTR